MPDIEFSWNGLENIQPKISEDLIKRLEKDLGEELPRDYKEFLLEHNGGCPSNRYFLIKRRRRGDPPDQVTYFCFLDKYGATPIEDGLVYSISSAHGRFGDMIPEDCLIVGQTISDNILLLSVRGRRRGQVLLKAYWNLDLFDDYSKTRNKAVYRVAPSFTAFLKMLRGRPSKKQ